MKRKFKATKKKPKSERGRKKSVSYAPYAGSISFSGDRGMGEATVFWRGSRPEQERR